MAFLLQQPQRTRHHEKGRLRGAASPGKRDTGIDLNPTCRLKRPQARRQLVPLRDGGTEPGSLCDKSIPSWPDDAPMLNSLSVPPAWGSQPQHPATHQCHPVDVHPLLKSQRSHQTSLPNPISSHFLLQTKSKLTAFTSKTPGLYLTLSPLSPSTPSSLARLPSSYFSNIHRSFLTLNLAVPLCTAPSMYFANLHVH